MENRSRKLSFDPMILEIYMYDEGFQKLVSLIMLDRLIFESALVI